MLGGRPYPVERSAAYRNADGKEFVGLAALDLPYTMSRNSVGWGLSSGIPLA
jgi:hypothetical protein